METQCPSCHARATLPDDPAPTKVRCSDCGRVFLARLDRTGPRLRRARTGLVLGGLVGVLALFALIVLLNEPSGADAAPDRPTRVPASAHE